MNATFTDGIGYRGSACGRHTSGKGSLTQANPNQRFSTLHLRPGVQLAVHTRVAAFILLILLDRALASVLILRFLAGYNLNPLGYTTSRFFLMCHGTSDRRAFAMSATKAADFQLSLAPA
jgi:hypothetical protein